MERVFCQANAALDPARARFRNWIGGNSNWLIEVVTWRLAFPRRVLGCWSQWRERKEPQTGTWHLRRFLQPAGASHQETARASLCVSGVIGKEGE